MGGPRRSQSSFVSKRRSEDAVISGDSGKLCNLQGILFVECNNARCEIHFLGARLNAYLRNIGYVATRYDLQSATIKCLETLCYASKRKLRSAKLVRLQLAARTGRVRLSKDILPIGGLLTDQKTKELRGI